MSNKKKGAFDFHQAEPTGTFIVDSIMTLIYSNRMAMRALDTLWLNEKYWNEFKDWVRSNDETIDFNLTELDFDGVKIKKQLFPDGSKPIINTYFNETLELPNR